MTRLPSSQDMVQEASKYRNRVAVLTVNAILNLVATPAYRDWIDTIIRYGMDSLARDTIENRKPPAPWQERLMKRDH